MNQQSLGVCHQRGESKDKTHRRVVAVVTTDLEKEFSVTRVHHTNPEPSPLPLLVYSLCLLGEKKNIVDSVFARIGTLEIRSSTKTLNQPPFYFQSSIRRSSSLFPIQTFFFPIKSLRLQMSASNGRSRSGDRFYTPPAVRRQLQLQQQQKQTENLDRQKDKQQRSQRSGSVSTQRTKSLAESDDCASSTTATTTTNTPRASVASVSVSDGGGHLSNLTNLDRFLEHTTPSVIGQQFSKTSIRGWRTKEDEVQPYFVLGDLWESFREWSVYGAGVPLLLNGSDSVVQYYVPYLSGIQLYVDPSMPTPRSSRLGEESDADSSRESSGGSSDYETENVPNGFLHGHSHQDLMEASRQGIKRLTISNKISVGSSSDEGESASFPGVLKFEYLEHDTPYNREPLTDKISLLATRFEELKTYRSCDLTPASWISVAWYPIYRIPMGPTLKNLDSCFLTFHLLSTPVHGTQIEWQNQHSSIPREVRQESDMASKLSLPIFGLASLKFNAVFWEQEGGADGSQKASSLLRTADDWLQQLNVSHPDYRFFASHNYWR